MGLYDDILEDQQTPNVASQKTIPNNNTNSGLFDDIFAEQPQQTQPTFKENHPFLASTPEALKQFGKGAVHSYPEFAKGLNDAIALAGDKTGIKGLSNFGRKNAEYWGELADNTQRDARYQGIKGLSSKETVLPTILGSIGDQATNIGMAMGGGAGGAVVSKAAGLGKIGTGIATFAGTSLPNLAQEGSYLDKIQAFQQIHGRIPTPEELKHIQNVALGEKAINTALETVGDKMLFGKVLPKGSASKSLKGISQKALEQAITEATTEGMQESVSIGAENILGINQGNNLERIADSMAIGGITGAAYGGAGSAMAQPIDTQLPNFENSVNPVQALQNVSAKIVDGGKVLYDSASDTLNSAAQNIGNAVNSLNQPNSFDTLMSLSRNGDLSNQAANIEQIAPKTAEKIKKTKKTSPEAIINNSGEAAVQNTNMPNLMADNQNLYNVEQGGENNVVDMATVQELANEVNQPQAASQAVMEKPQEIVENKISEKELRKIAAKKRAIEKLAPKTVEKIQKENTKNNNVQHTIDFQKGNIVRDVNTNQVYEVLEADNLGMGKLRDVDTNEISTLNAHNNAHFTKYAPEEKEYITKKEFKYDPKAKEFENAENYIFSQQEVVDAYNNYIKNPTEANRETYEDTYGKYNNEYVQKAETLKSKIEKIAPKTAAKIKENKTAKKYKGAKEIPVGTFKKDVGGAAWYLNKSDKKAKFYSTLAVSNEIGLLKNESNSYKELLDKLQYSPEGSAIVKYYQDAGVPYEEFNPQYNGTLPIKIINKENANKKESEVENGRSIEETNGIRPSENERQEETRENSSGVSQKQSANAGTSDEVGRRNNVSDEQRGISPKDKEIIEKEYKNQHELNKAIEDYINNEEYRKYAGSIRMPQVIKNWLKKYAGAGGLEKQGAEGKGLLSEYYTPQNIVNKMWDLTKQYVNTNGAKVLEPSVGIGRFLETAPENTNFDVVEMNPVSAMITKILYPDANVTTGEFQEKFINKTNNTPVKNVTPEYDIVIGNPPYGQYSGRYKGLGEGKKYSRLEAYFINRGLDSLKENGIMTFIVPSSFLDGAITVGKQEIGSKCELLDAYRLPENTFDTTSIGTDIIVLRKTSLKAPEKNLNFGNWFKDHPEKVLGTVEERKNRFGKMENYVKGDKNAVENIDTSKSDIKETKEVVAKSATTKKSTVRKSNTSTKENLAVKKGSVEYTEYQPENPVSDEDMELFNDTRVDGTLPGSKYSPNEKVNQFNGKLYNDFNYLQGDIYEKLDALEKENIPENQKEIQRKKLNSILPEKKTVNQIAFNPTSDFIREYVMGIEDEEYYDYSTRSNKTRKINATLDRKYKKYIENLTNSERNGVNTWDIRRYIDGDKINLDYHYSSYSLTEAEKKKERSMQKAEYMTKLKNTVDKTFNDFVRNELSKEEKQKLEDAWNRTFNAVYNPDYKTMPMIVKGLNSEFNGKKLVLQNVQVEGVNFLTNKGVGLLGFEVGVGKTLTGIISTVQNMQMGRCKKPLILVPKQVKENWIREINQAFPNIKINDVDNMSKFKGEIPENTLTVATYEALGNIWYGDMSPAELSSIIYQVGLNNAKYDNLKIDHRESTKRAKEKAKERAVSFVGMAEKGNKKLFNIQDLGFDHITIDEAHNFKNLFADVKADGQDGNAYVNISGGSTSTRAVRLFLLAQYILNNNNNRNVFMLTATPFNNSPLEVFNMTSFLAKDKLEKMGLYNVYQFMENYADISSDWIVNSRNEVEYKQVVTGFKNATSLRELIKSVMLIRSAEDAGIKRPEKFTKRVILEPSQSQIELIQAAEEEAVNGKKDEGAVLKAINQSRKATLSPDIATDNFDVSPEDFVKNSPKIDYVMSAVEAMRKKDTNTSQIIYMPLGVKFLPKMKQYLVNRGSFKANEIAIIDSGVTDDKITKYTDSFNDPNGEVKLVIGTNKIKEGMNLNKNSSVLYVPYMDWNPTDFVQVVGRIWRRGNKYDKIRVVVPLLKNSSDSFMFQKLNEKTDRINNIMDESKEYIDTSELNTAEEKINMISNPDKKVRMFIKVEQQKLEAEVKNLRGRLDTSQSYKSSLESLERQLNHAQEKVKELSEEIKLIDPEKNKWNYEYTEDRLKEYKKNVREFSYSLQKTKEKISRLELDFNGKDSEDIINGEISKIEERIKQLDKYGDKKLVEYKEQYEKERMNSKTVAELIKEFDKETEELYGKSAANKTDESKAIGVEPKKKYEQTRENYYDIPVIKLETQSQKSKKSKTQERIEKAKSVGDARRYNKQLKDGVAKWHAEIETRRYDANKVINKFVNLTKNIAREVGVNDKNLREIMPFLRERTELPENLIKKRPELKETWDKVHSDKKIAARITELADKVANIFDRYYKEYLTVQAKGEDIEDRTGVENYVPHLWQRDKSGNYPLLTNSYITNSKHAKQRTIPTYYEGIQGIKQENGEVKTYEPENLDYAVLFKKASDNLIKATVDKVFADSVKNFKTSEGANLVLPVNQAPSNWVRIDHHALNKTVGRPITTKFGEKISPKLQNILSDIGIAIGNRLSKYKGNGTPNSYGKYVKNVPPEIRLQKWFSNKTLAHEIGHGLDDILNLSQEGFVNRHRNELLDLNKERIEAFGKQGERSYAESDRELIAELFGVMFNDVESALRFAPTATQEVITKMSGNPKLEKLLPANFDWSEAKHVMEEKVVEFFSEPVSVHPDIASTLKTVFENKQEYLNIHGFEPGKLLDESNAVAKMVNFSLSGFHGVALSESHVGNTGVKSAKDILNFKGIYDGIKNGEYDVYKKDTIARQAINDGLQLGTPMDVDRGTFETILDNAGKWAETHIKGIGKPISMTTKVAEKATEINNKVLWDVIHNNYKLSTYEFLIDNETRRKGTELSQAERREIAQWTNDSFGGQVLEVLGISPSTKKKMSRWIMSPDWLISTTRQFMGMFSSKSGHKKINQLAQTSEFWQNVKDTTQFLGINSITDDIAASGMRGRIARKFWLRSFIFSAIYMNILNAAFRLWDRDKNKDLYPENMSPFDYSMAGNSTGQKLYIFIGRNKDGSERYLRLGKQFREVPEMLQDPIKHFGNKVAPIPQAIITAGTGRSMGGFENKEISKSSGWGRVGFAAKNLGKTYLPYSVTSAIQKGADFSPFDLIGNTGKGMTEYKAKEAFKNAYEHRNNVRQIEDVRRSMRLNGFNAKDIKKAENSAKTLYLKKYKDNYKEALKAEDISKITKITNKMEKANVSPIDQRKIYTKALSEFYKDKGVVQ